MNATANPPIGTEPVDGFGAGVDAPELAASPAPVAKPTAKVAAPAPVAAAAAPAAPAPAADPAQPASLLAAAASAPAYAFKADGMHADDLKVFGDVLGEGKVDPKTGQTILDKMLPALAARREAEVKAKWDAIQKDWRDQNAKDPLLDPSKPENAARAKLALDIAGADVIEQIKADNLTDHPAWNRLIARFGAYVEKATKPDNAVPGASPTPAPKHSPGDTSSAAWAPGVTAGF